MSDNPLAIPIPPLASPSEAEYDSTLAAVMETARGRWFLTEYARRNQPSTTESGLAAIQRMEAAILGEHGAQSFDRLRLDMTDMAQAIARTKAEIAAIQPSAEHQGEIGNAAVEFDSIAQAMESAAKAMQALSFLDSRIDAIIAFLDTTPASEEKKFQDALADDPLPPPAGPDQTDIDRMQEPQGASAEERRDASIEDIGRLMMALQVPAATEADEAGTAANEIPAEEAVSQSEAAPVEEDVSQPEATLIEEVVSQSEAEAAEGAAIAAAVFAEPASAELPAEPAAAAVFDDITGAALETKPTLTVPKEKIKAAPSMLERIQAALFLPRPATPPSVPEPEAMTEEVPIAVLEAIPLPNVEPVESVPPENIDVEPAATENVPDTANSVFELTMDTIVASAVEPSALPPEREETEAPAPPAQEAAPVAAVASFELESEAFLFGPDPSPEISAAIPKDESGLAAASYDDEASHEEQDPADFLLDPAPTSVPSPSFATLLAQALERPVTAASAVSQPAPLLPTPQLESTAVPEVAPAFPSKPASKPAARMPNDPLAPLRALSDEEKIALFS
jgi:hypothetical protein